jgi:hypothetical protein
MIRYALSLIVVLALSLAASPQAEAGPLCAIGGAARHFVAHRFEGVQRRHQRRVERRQSGHGVAKALPRNW